jgi:hypothetical protein
LQNSTSVSCLRHEFVIGIIWANLRFGNQPAVALKNEPLIATRAGASVARLAKVMMREDEVVELRAKQPAN